MKKKEVLFLMCCFFGIIIFFGLIGLVAHNLRWFLLFGAIIGGSIPVILFLYLLEIFRDYEVGAGTGIYWGTIFIWKFIDYYVWSDIAGLIISAVVAILGTCLVVNSIRKDKGE